MHKWCDIFLHGIGSESVNTNKEYFSIDLIGIYSNGVVCAGIIVQPIGAGSCCFSARIDAYCYKNKAQKITCKLFHWSIFLYLLLACHRSVHEIPSMHPLFVLI